MSIKGPASPGKAKLIKDASLLPSLEYQQRQFLSSGDQSIILADGHKHVLLITRFTNAKKIELLREKLKENATDLIEVPTLVATNANLIGLLTSNPAPSPEEIKRYKHQYSLPSTLLENNVVYRLPRHEGNLENLINIRFKEDSIDLLQQSLLATIDHLHQLGLTHNDISLRNILYSGTYPNFTFRLCDWGSLTQSDPKKQKKKYANDISSVSRVIGKVKAMLTNKQRIKEKMQNSDFSIMYGTKAQKMGISPVAKKAAETANDIKGLDAVKTVLFASVQDDTQDTILFEKRPSLIVSLKIPKSSAVSKLKGSSSSEISKRNRLG